MYTNTEHCLKLWAAAVNNTKKPLPKLQKVLTSLIHDRVTSEIKPSLNVIGLTRLAACSAKGTSAAFTAVPTDGTLMFSQMAGCLQCPPGTFQSDVVVDRVAQLVVDAGDVSSQIPSICSGSTPRGLACQGTEQSTTPQY